MQDLNNQIFDTDKYDSPSQMWDSLMKEPSETIGGKGPIDFIEDYDDSSQSRPSRVEEDIKNQKAFTTNKIKANIFDTLFEQEQQIYFNEHKHIMPSQEKRRLKKLLIKKISKGDIYINKVGKLIIRKGKNK